MGSLARFLNFRTDQILMGFLTTEAALGFYAVAVNVSEVLLYLPSSAATALLPLIARTEPTRRGQETLRAFRSVIFVTAAGVAVAALLGPFVLPAVFGDAFDESVIPFLWLLPGTFGYATSAVFSSALVGSSSPGLSSLGPMVSLVVGFALDLALIPHLRGDGSGSRGQRGVPGRRRGGAAHVSPREPVPVADDARPPSRRPRRAGCARRPLAAGAPSP